MSATKIFFLQKPVAMALVAGLVAIPCVLCAHAQSLDGLPAPATKSPIDVAAIAKGYQAGGTLAPDPTATIQPRLLILVSFSMPEASLVRLADQARHAGAVLVLNGLKDNSLTATAQTVRRIFGPAGTPLQIDPRAFSRYGVIAVPSFVLLADDAASESCSGETCPTINFAAAAGDVSLDYALENLGTKGGIWRSQAQQLLRRLGK